jgi:hypothetical protein
VDSSKAGSANASSGSGVIAATGFGGGAVTSTAAVAVAARRPWLPVLAAPELRPRCGAAALRGRASWARATIALICWASSARSQLRSEGSVIRCGTAGAIVDRR